MKLSKLIPHTSAWIGIPEAQVRTVVRALRPAGLISSAGQNPQGADMTTDDKINLLLGVCGVGIANRAAEHVRVWRQLIISTDDDRFAFTRAKTVKDFFVGLITEDLNGGALDVWLKESDDSFDRYKQLKAHPRHEMTLDFYVDAFWLTLVVSRTILDQEANPKVALERARTESIKTRAIATFELFSESRDLHDKGYKAGSQLIRRLNAENIRGWGTCLTDDPQ